MRVREIKARKPHVCAAREDGSWARACRSIRSGDLYHRVTVFPGEHLSLWQADDIEGQNRPESIALCATCGPAYTT